MIINVILPYKDKFFIHNPSSVSITVQKNLNYSIFKDNIRVYGSYIENPKFPENYIGITKSKNPFLSKNYFLAKKVIENIRAKNDTKQLIEIHNRPYLIKLFLKRLQKFPISIFYHNDPLEMMGSKSINERKFILQNVQKVFCVSNYIKDRFLLGINDYEKKVEVLYNGVDRLNKKFPVKNRNILFVGKLIPEKGIDIFLDMALQLKQKHKNWFFEIVGEFSKKTNGSSSSFKSKVLKKINLLGEKVRFYGSLDYIPTQEKFKKASIVVVPSVWEEPFGLVVAEAMSNGAAVVASDVGGIPEIIKENGILIKNIDSGNLSVVIRDLVEDRDKLRKYQKFSWENFDFFAKKSSNLLDKKRSEILFKFFDCC